MYGPAHLDRGLLVETVHLIKELKQDSLNFSIRSSLCIESLRGDSIDFVDKDDTWRVLSS
jgi:hypothetical protein